MLCANCNAKPATVWLPSHVCWCMACVAELALLGAHTRGKRRLRSDHAYARTVRLTPSGVQAADALRRVRARQSLESQSDNEV